MFISFLDNDFCHEEFFTAYCEVQHFCELQEILVNKGELDTKKEGKEISYYCIGVNFPNVINTYYSENCTASETINCHQGIIIIVLLVFHVFKSYAGRTKLFLSLHFPLSLPGCQREEINVKYINYVPVV